MTVEIWSVGPTRLCKYCHRFMAADTDGNILPHTKFLSPEMCGLPHGEIMEEFYVLDGRLTVIGTVTAKNQQQAAHIASSRHGVGVRVTAVRGQTPEQAEDFVREELED